MKRFILAVVAAIALMMPTFAEVSFDGYCSAQSELGLFCKS